MERPTFAGAVLFVATLSGLPGVAGCSGPPPQTQTAPPPPSRPSKQAGQTAVTQAPSGSVRFLDPAAASSWSFPDSATRRGRAERLAKKLQLQLDSEHDRAVTGAGFTFALVVDGDVVLLHGRGVADLENQRVATPDTIYRIASVTKTLTASAIVALRDDGKLTLSDPLAAHLPELDVVYPHRDASPIRVEQVLTHSAGLMRSGPYAELARASTEADLVTAMQMPLTSDPGLGHRYSNFGFGLLGLVVAREGRGTYRDFVRTRLLEPLGMSSSGFDLAALPSERLAVGYRQGARGTYSPVPMSANGAGEAAGGMYSTARDMAAWIRFQLQAWPPRNDPDDAPMKRASLREMHTPRLPYALAFADVSGETSRAQSKSVGLAWEVTKGCYFDRLVGHDGDLEGFHARVRFDVDRNFGFVLLGNTDGADLTGVAERVLDTIVTEDALAPRRREPAAVLVERTSAALARLGSTWREEDHATTFSETLRSQFTSTNAIALGERIAKDVGTCTYARPEAVTDALDAELVFTCERGTLRATARGTGTPLQLYGFRVDVMKPANEDQLAVASAIVRRMTSRDDAALAKELHTKGVASSAKMLLEAGREAGACRVEGGEVSPWSHAASFRLGCAKTRATLRLQERASGVLDIVAIDTPPRKCLR